MVDEFAKALRWSETEKRLHIKSNLEDGIRSMFTDSDDFTAEEMLHQLIMRYGVTMSHSEVHNELVQIVRQPNEGLHQLADRVRNMARKAHMPNFRRQSIMRDTFFAALRPNKELQHYVDRYDDIEDPNMINTLNLALDWEMKHGTQHNVINTEEIRDETYIKSETFTEQTEGESETSIQEIDYIDIEKLKSQEAKKIGKQQNETTRLLNEWMCAEKHQEQQSDQSNLSSTTEDEQSSSCESSREDCRRTRSRTRKRKQTRNKRHRTLTRKRRHEARDNNLTEEKERKNKHPNRTKKIRSYNKKESEIEGTSSESTDSRDSRATSTSSRSSSSDLEKEE